MPPEETWAGCELLDGAVVAGVSDDDLAGRDRTPLPEEVDAALAVWRRAASPLNSPTPAREAAANQAVATRARPRTEERWAAGDGMSQLSHQQLGKG